MLAVQRSQSTTSSYKSLFVVKRSPLVSHLFHLMSLAAVPTSVNQQGILSQRKACGVTQAPEIHRSAARVGQGKGNAFVLTFCMHACVDSSLVWLQFRVERCSTPTTTPAYVQAMLIQRDKADESDKDLDRMIRAPLATQASRNLTRRCSTLYNGQTPTLALCLFMTGLALVCPVLERRLC